MDFCQLHDKNRERESAQNPLKIAILLIFFDF